MGAIILVKTADILQGGGVVQMELRLGTLDYK